MWGTSLVIERISNNIFDNLPSLSMPKVLAFDEELTRYFAALSNDISQPLPKQRPICSVGGLKIKKSTLIFLGWPEIISVFLVSNWNSISLSLFIFPYSATSVDIEHVFSKGRLLLSHVSNRLTVDSTWALLCFGTWSRSGFVNKEDLHTAALLPEVKEGKEELPDDFDLIL